MSHGRQGPGRLNSEVAQERTLGVALLQTFYGIKAQIQTPMKIPGSQAQANPLLADTRVIAGLDPSAGGRHA
jgi:hypothetical protein